MALGELKGGVAEEIGGNVNVLGVLKGDGGSDAIPEQMRINGMTKGFFCVNYNPDINAF